MRRFLIILIMFSIVGSGYSDDDFTFTYRDGDQPWLKVDPDDIYETPEAKAYAEIWQQAFKKRNGMSDEYFDEHIDLVNCQMKERMIPCATKKETDCPKRLREFLITFYYHIDWAQKQLRDKFTVSLDGACDSTTLADVMAYVEKDDVRNICGADAHISWIKPVEHIATQEQIRRAVKEASGLLTLDVNWLTRLSRDGLLQCDLRGTVDYNANECIEASIRLLDATVFDLKPCPCWIY